MLAVPQLIRSSIEFIVRRASYPQVYILIHFPQWYVPIPRACTGADVPIGRVLESELLRPLEEVVEAESRRCVASLQPSIVVWNHGDVAVAVAEGRDRPLDPHRWSTGLDNNSLI